MPQLTRRAALAAAALLLPAVPAPAAGTANDDLNALEKSTGTRIGVAALDTGDGRKISFRESERFIMCSSFKLSLAAAVLQRVETGREKLDRVVHYQKGDLLAVSPATTRNLSTGMTVEALCEAAVVYSDNTAATLLIASIGEPQGVTNFWRSLRDRTSRLDRIEPALNVPDGVKDTTTPSAMLGDLKAMLLDDGLSSASRQRLLGWLAASTTGIAMLRAGLPKDWIVGDKTGRYVQEPYNAAIDLAIATPPGHKPILITAFTMNSRGDDAAHQAVLAEIGKIVARRFA